MPADAPQLSRCTAVLAHGAGSSPEFLRRAFPAERLGVAECRYIDDRTGSIDSVAAALSAALRGLDRPAIVGGVSLGAHAAAMLLATPPRPDGVVAGLFCMPAWTGTPDRVAAMTAAAAAAVASLDVAGVLDGLDPGDWVTPVLASSWALRSAAELRGELETASRQSAPDGAGLRRIDVPVGIVALADDPLHPAAVARAWASAIPRASMSLIPRTAPAADLAIFADQARAALTSALQVDRR